MIFTVDVEWPWHAISLREAWPTYASPRDEALVYRLLAVLKRHHVAGIFYILGHVAVTSPQLIRDIAAQGHTIGNHGYWHGHGERFGGPSYHQAAHAIFTALEGNVSGPYPYRSPYWDSTPRPGWSGGRAFRWLPRWFLLRELRRTGVFWLHPHDLRTWRLPGEPYSRRPLKRPWERLEWLLHQVTWDDPRRTH